MDFSLCCAFRLCENENYQIECVIPIRHLAERNLFKL